MVASSGFHPPESKASSEVANLVERKNLHTIYMVSKNLSVCLSVVNFYPNYLRTGKKEWLEIFLGHPWQNECSQNFLFISPYGWEWEKLFD